MTRAREVRWIVLVTDGRHVTVGRHSDPSPAEIADAESQLARQGFAGWLAIMRGDYHGSGALEFVLVRPLANPTTPWDDAVLLLEARRAELLRAA